MHLSRLICCSWVFNSDSRVTDLWISPKVIPFQWAASAWRLQTTASSTMRLLSGKTPSTTTSTLISMQWRPSLKFYYWLRGKCKRMQIICGINQLGVWPLCRKTNYELLNVKEMDVKTCLLLLDDTVDTVILIGTKLTSSKDKWVIELGAGKVFEIHIKFYSKRRMKKNIHMKILLILHLNTNIRKYRFDVLGKKQHTISFLLFQKECRCLAFIWIASTNLIISERLWIYQQFCLNGNPIALTFSLCTLNVWKYLLFVNTLSNLNFKYFMVYFAVYTKFK